MSDDADWSSVWARLDALQREQDNINATLAKLLAQTDRLPFGLLLVPAGGPCPECGGSLAGAGDIHVCDLVAAAAPAGDTDPMAQRCKRCGRADGIDFHVSDEAWERIAGAYNVLCPWCFDSLALEMDATYEIDSIYFAGRAGSFVLDATELREESKA